MHHPETPLNEIRLNEISKLDQDRRKRALEKIGREYAIIEGLPSIAARIRKDMGTENFDLLFQAFREKVPADSINLFQKEKVFYWEWRQSPRQILQAFETHPFFLTDFIRGYAKEIFEELFDQWVEVEVNAADPTGSKAWPLAVKPLDAAEQWIHSILAQLDLLPENKGIALLEQCGRVCGRSHDLAGQAQEIRDQVQDKNDLDRLFILFKEKAYQNSPRLYKQGEIIYLEYHQCGCPLVKAGKANNSFFCHCTRGYTKERFENLFAKPVRVDLLESILRGNKICKQAITIIED
ncbi:MAG: hypothetical protein EHM45_22185 [Desulfobacteraceae bacterium]|nr:MAG: hypothetical protein EHM45_22185 [Desulfobacteraceae bacterium]